MCCSLATQRQAIISLQSVVDHFYSNTHCHPSIHSIIHSFNHEVLNACSFRSCLGLCGQRLCWSSGDPALFSSGASFHRAGYAKMGCCHPMISLGSAGRWKRSGTALFVLSSLVFHKQIESRPVFQVTSQQFACWPSCLRAFVQSCHSTNLCKHCEPFADIFF